MKKIFEEFKPVDYETWLAQIKKDLKDKPIEALFSNPESDIEIKAFHHPEKDLYNGITNSFANNFSRNSNEWKIRKNYGPESNAQILNDLNEGIDAISSTIENQKQYDSISQGVLFEHIVSDFKFESKDSAVSVKVNPYSVLNFDIISLNAKNGKWNFLMEDFYTFYQTKSDNKTIWIEGSLYGDAGASTIQELAFTLAHLNEYIQFLKDKGESLENINSKIVIELSINENYFVNISKFRAMRELVALLFSGYDKNYVVKTPLLFAKTSPRFFAENDRNTNYLRQTTQAMSAVLGGCDVLAITNVHTKETKELNDRMAKNISLILREESYFDKVNDVAAGSYYIENLTNQLIEKAWNLFLEIEDQGGLIASLKSNKIQEKIEVNKNDLIEKMNLGERTFLGVNKFQSKLEKWVEVNKPETKNDGEFLKLFPFRLESYFSQKTTA